MIEYYTDKKGNKHEIKTGSKGGRYYEVNGKKHYLPKVNRIPFWLEHSSDKVKHMAAVMHYNHEETVAHCEYCNTPLTRSDVNDYGSLCERCYYKEYYNKDI